MFYKQKHQNLSANDFFTKAEIWLMRTGVFLIFLVGFLKVLVDTLEKILK